MPSRMLVKSSSLQYIRAGTVELEIDTDVIVVIFTEAFTNLCTSVVFSLENLNEEVLVVGKLVSKTLMGFSVKFSNVIPTANYILNYIAYGE
jgi:hypothetical protein